MRCYCTFWEQCEPCEVAEYRRLTAFLHLDDRDRYRVLKDAGLRKHIVARCQSPLVRHLRLSERVCTAATEVFKALLPDEQERITKDLPWQLPVRRVG